MRNTSLYIWAEYLGGVLLYRLLRCVPLRLVGVTGRALGSLAFVILRKHRTRTIDHLLHAAVVSSRKDAAALAKENFIQLALTSLEIAKFDQFSRRNDPLSCLSGADTEKLHELAQESGGLIVVSAHFGNWELCAQVCSRFGKRLHCVTLPTPNPKINDFVRRWRSSDSLRTVDRKGALRHLLRALKAEDVVVLLVDQRAHRKEGMMATFFGQPARTHTGPAQLHFKTDAPVILVLVRRVGAPFRYELILRGPFRVERTGDADRDVERLTQLYTHEIEDVIRENPTQWLWAHRRWNNRERTRNRRHRRPVTTRDHSQASGVV